MGQRWLGQPGEHEPQAVEQLGTGAEGAADARYTGALVQGQSRRDIEHLVHLSPGSLGHPAAGVGGEGLQVAPGALSIEDTQCQGGFARTGDAGNADDLVEGDIHINIFEVVNPCASDLDRARGSGSFFYGDHLISVLVVWESRGGGSAVPWRWILPLFCAPGRCVSRPAACFLAS